MSKPTVAELLSRVEKLEYRLAQLEAKPTSTRTEKQRSVQYRVDDAEIEARRAKMEKAKTAAIASGRTVRA